MKLRLSAIGAVAAAATVCAIPGGAQAADDFPCAKDTTVKWTKERVQLCPIGAPLAGGKIPVYRSPVAKKKGAPVPRATAGTTHGSARYFVCDRRVRSAVYFHPGGWWNDWWALTLSDTGQWGWVPEVFFKGGGNGRPDAALRHCPPPPKPPPPPPPCALLSKQSGFQVKAHFRRSGRVKTAGFGRKLRVTGTVVAPDGSPAAGAALCVGEQRVGGRSVEQQAMINADAQGRFSYTLGAGASRRVWFVHHVGAASAAGNVTVRVRARVSLRARPRSLSNGQTVALRGRLGGRPRGILVELQYARGGRWLNFATTRTRRGGRFRFAYKFTRTFASRSYRFRARAQAQRGYPFATGASRPVRVHVSG